MGLRLWIRTKEEPKFTNRTQWHFLNQSLEIDNELFWFFQDEWEEDITLYRCAGLTNKDPHGTLQKMYYKPEKRLELINKLCNVSSDDIDIFFKNEWERPIPYWDAHRILAIAYLEAKRDYLTSLKEATIIEINDVDEIIGNKLPCWYGYRYTG